MDPLSLDWGAATAEFQNDEAKSAVHIFNHDLTTPERVERTIRFAEARLAWCATKMPGFTQEVWYDEREQKVEAPSKEKIKAQLAGKATGLMFMSEGGE
jgi:hypothetical protein